MNAITTLFDIALDGTVVSLNASRGRRQSSRAIEDA